MMKAKCGIVLVFVAVMLMACNTPIANGHTYGTDDTQATSGGVQKDAELQNHTQPDKVLIYVVTEDRVAYSEEELQELAQFQGTITELTEQHPATRVHRWGNNYVVIYFGNGKAAYVLFNMDGKDPYGQVFSIVNRSNAFEDLKVGDTLDKVYEMDPDGRYPFLETGNGLPDKFSQHFTEDRYFITINYEEDDAGTIRITHINWERY